MSGAQAGKSGGDAQWLAVAAGTIGAMMATLDISIVNAALPRIQGEIGASGEEGTWVSTAYLVAEIIMIPLAGWFVRILSLRTFLLIVTIGFTFFSVMCGLSENLIEMIMGRVGQGFTGGAMIPTAMTIVATKLPKEKQPVGMALFGLVVVMGPALGPAIGGWLTEYYSWHYAFFLNLPVGIGLVALLLTGLPPEKTHLGLLARADWLGMFGMALGLSCLTVITEEGQRQRWLESTIIDWLAVFSALGFALLIVRQFIAEQPIVNLRLIMTRAFGSVFVMGLVVGGALYGTLYLIPQYLTGVSNYNPAESGYVVSYSGIPALMTTLMYPFLVKTFDIRIIIAFGFFLYAVSCFIDAGLTPLTAGPEFVWPQIMRGFGQVLCMMFLNQAATAAVGKGQQDDASGLFNAARNLGGSIGLSVISHLQDSRNWLHTRRLEEFLTRDSARAQDYMQSMGARFGQGDAQAGMGRAYGMLAQEIHTQASVMTYADIFFVFGCFLIAVIPLVFFLKPLPKDGKEGKPA